SKITTKKTAGILGDDLAVNAEKATGFVASREIPVLWAITKGSFLNKIIILPVAFLLSAFLPPAITILLVLGGVYLAFEGAEKIYEYIVPHKESAKVVILNEPTEEEVLALEKSKIKSAILTDFILSVEIVIIALGTVIGRELLFQILVVSIVAIIATVGVYGVVALIVRMDDLGWRLIKRSGNKETISKTIGMFLVQALPWVIKSLSVIGTLALLLVSGGIFVHNVEFLHHFLDFLPAILQEFVVGLLVGFAAFLVITIFKKVVFKKVRH